MTAQKLALKMIETEYLVKVPRDVSFVIILVTMRLISVVG